MKTKLVNIVFTDLIHFYFTFASDCVHFLHLVLFDSIHNQKPLPSQARAYKRSIYYIV